MLDVSVIGPGPGAEGGVGAMAGYLGSTSSQRTRIRFDDPGSSRGPALRRLLAFFAVAADCLLGRDDQRVRVLSLAGKGSTWRKLVLAGLLRLRDRPYAIHLHGGSYPEFLAAQRPLARKAITIMFQQAGRVIVLGDVWADFVRTELHVAEQRIARLPNCVPGPETVPERDEAPRILFSGRVGPRKGAPELLEAWSALHSEHPMTLVLAGDLDDPYGSIRAQVEASDDIELTGWVDENQLREHLRDSNILVLPSHVENLPLSLLEGMAWGLAPISTPVGAITEVIRDGENGLLIPVGDPQSLTHALRRLVEDLELRRSLARAARQTWEDGYALPGYRNRYDDIMEAVAEVSHRHPTRSGGAR